MISNFSRAVGGWTIVVMCWCCTNLCAQTSYTITEIGDAFAQAINDSGQATGSWYDPVALRYQAFLWDPAIGFTSVGTLGELHETEAFDITNSGVVVGYDRGGLSNESVAFMWDSAHGLTALEKRALQTESFAYGANNVGQIVGYSTVDNHSRACMWSGDTGLFAVTNLGDLPGGGDHSSAHAINDLGQVVGWSSGAGGWRAFRWDSAGGMVDLGLPSATYWGSDANDINNQGEIVGWSGLVGPKTRPFYYNPSTGMIDIGHLPGLDYYTVAYAINDDGVVVGVSSSTSTQRAFVWDAFYGMRDLNDWLDSSGTGWELTFAFDVNSNGQIVGEGVNPDGDVRAFLLTPTTIPVVVAPTSVTPTRGTHVGGGIFEFSGSDNLDYRMQRNFSDLQARIEYELESTSPVQTPTSMEVTLECSVFSRSNVTQTIELYNYETLSWEHIDTRDALRFNDQTVTVDITGDLSRFVEPGTQSIEARIRFASTQQRNQFAAHTDQFVWLIR